ncbi:MAG: hypothetical protein N3A65_00835 [candidate division WOR-3 bacterium]|nr:hypothetical protein [candidate division WOR-3 bacterium]
MIYKRVSLSLWLLIASLSLVFSAGPSLDPALKARIDFNYQFGVCNNPLPEEDEPDTADFLIPAHKSMFRLRKRFTPKDVFVFRYEFREYTLRENSYRRFIEPITHEFDHRIKFGAGYASSPQVFPYFFYEYLRSLNNSQSHSGILGVRINIGLASMFEPTYAFMLNNGSLFHSVILRWQQILTPRTYLMLKNSFIFPNFSATDEVITWTNSFEPFIAHRITEKNALQFGYRQFNNFAGTKTYTIWSQYVQQITKRNTTWVRLRIYSRPQKDEGSTRYYSFSGELRLMRKPLSEKGKLKNLSVSFYNIFLKSNTNIWANTTGIELNYLFPK